MNTTARIALKLIPDSLQTQPVFLCVDDTMVSKFGTKFENVSKLFDHAAHNGSNFLNQHELVDGDVLQNMGNVFLWKQILLFPMKRSVIIISVSVGFSLRSSVIKKSLLMSLPQKKSMVQNDCFSVPFSRKTCRFSVPGRKKLH